MQQTYELTPKALAYLRRHQRADRQQRRPRRPGPAIVSRRRAAK